VELIQRKANVRINVTMGGVRKTNFHGKALIIRYFECVFSPSYLARKLHEPYCIVLSSLAFLAIPHFSILRHKPHDFG